MDKTLLSLGRLKTASVLASAQHWRTCRPLLPSKAAAVFTRCMTLSTRLSGRGLVRISDEVQNAVVGNRPVVALESTIITHGMPYPNNVQTARNVERICRDNGAVPATCAVLSGRLCIGLSENEIEHLGKTGQSVMKTSSRDIAYVLSQGLDGSLTVAGTLVAARSADISVLCTGGVGGVHRGATKSMDVSADLLELSRSHVTVVCAGAKSILDIGLTLEYLETLGVTVATFGAYREFPAFFTRSSGFKAPYDLTTAAEVAKLIDCSSRVKELRGGQLIAVPVPVEHAAEKSDIDRAIEDAVKEASAQGVGGKDVTPFLLARVNDLLKGKSLAANIALIENNAKVASQIAVELCKLRQGEGNGGRARYQEHVYNTATGVAGSKTNKANNFDMSNSNNKSRKIDAGLSKSSETGGVSDERSVRGNELTGKRSSKHLSNGCETSGKKEANEKRSNIVVIGGINYDVVSTFSKSPSEVVMDGTTNKGKIYQTFGGVGRNLAYCLARLDQKTFFISAVGSDLAGVAFRQYHSDIMDVSGVETLTECSTAVYVATVSSSGELIHGVGDFDIHSSISPHMVNKHKAKLDGADLVCIDGNIPAVTMDYVTNICQQCNIPVWFEPTDTHHVTKLFQSDGWRRLTYASPNIHELEAMHSRLLETVPSAGNHTRHSNTSAARITAQTSPSESDAKSSVDAILSHCIEIGQPLLAYIPHLIVTLGKHGVLHLFSEKSLVSPLVSKTLRSNSIFAENGSQESTDSDTPINSNASKHFSNSSSADQEAQNTHNRHLGPNFQEELSASRSSSYQEHSRCLSKHDVQDFKRIVSQVNSLFKHGTFHSTGENGIWAVHYPAVSCGMERSGEGVQALDGKIQEPVSVSGAGDCMAATYIAGLLLGGCPDRATRSALRAASLSLRSSDTVPLTINLASVELH